MTGNFNEKINFPPKLLLTDRQVLQLCKDFANNSSTNVKLLKTHLSKIMQSGAFLGKHFGPMLKTGLSLTKNILKPLA